jgi:hypothetical protein
MVGFGLFARLGDRLFLKIILFGGHHKKKLVELNHMGIHYHFCSTLALNTVRMFTREFTTESNFHKTIYNNIKEK